MILLEKEHYYKVLKPLQGVSINHLFARAVVEKKISGKIYVDNLINPKTFYVIESYGMSLLFGDWTNTTFNNSFKDYALNTNHIRDNYEWMQTFPDNWNDMLSSLFGNILVESAENKKETGVIELNTRVNFKFCYEKYVNRKKKVIDNILEIGIETNNEFRRKGFAELVCCKLIDFCISNKYEPIWSCRLENTGSYMLAQKVGFEVAYKKPYYRLSK